MEFRKYLKFRSGTHRGREGRKECLLCVSVLWDYARSREGTLESLDSFAKSSDVLGSEAWEEYC